MATAPNSRDPARRPWPISARCLGVVSSAPRAWLPNLPTLGGPVTSGPVVRFSSERLRVVPWRGHHDIAQVTPVPNGLPPDAAAVGRCLRMLAERRVTEVVTGALAPAEQRAFLEAGFS